MHIRTKQRPMQRKATKIFSPHLCKAGASDSMSTGKGANAKPKVSVAISPPRAEGCLREVFAPQWQLEFPACPDQAPGN